MARRLSAKAYKINDINITLRFEAEQLTEQGLVVDYTSMNEVDAYFKDAFAEPSEDSLEKIAQTVHEFVEQWLAQEPTNTYKNLMGDEYPRVKILSVEAAKQDSYAATYGD
jgi:hypothetical protein